MHAQAPVAGPGAHLLCAILGACSGCHRRPPRESIPESQQPDYDKQSVAVVGETVVPPAPRCVLARPTRWLVPLRDAGTAPVPVEGAVLSRAPGGAGDWAAWLDRPARVLVAVAPSGAASRFELGAGELETPVLQALAGDRAVAVVVAQRAGAREHRVVVASSRGAASELFAQREGADDSFAVAVVATPSGALVAWDEDRGPSRDGAIVAQFVPAAALAADGAIAPPPSRAISRDGDDATEPELVALPSGGVVLVYLAAHDVDADAEANATASDVLLRPLSAEGIPTGDSVQITPGPANRFGAVALAHAGALWIAYRVAGDSDQESQGDGGLVALVRVGADLRPTASPAYLSDRDALPTGRPSIVPDGAGVTVFWTERRGEDTRTMRRSVAPDGRAVLPALDEPALDGELPSAGERAASVALVHGARGEPGVATVACPAIPPHAR